MQKNCSIRVNGNQLYNLKQFQQRVYEKLLIWFVNRLFWTQDLAKILMIITSAFC